MLIAGRPNKPTGIFYDSLRLAPNRNLHLILDYALVKILIFLISLCSLSVHAQNAYHADKFNYGSTNIANSALYPYALDKSTAVGETYAIDVWWYDDGGSAFDTAMTNASALAQSIDGVTANNLDLSIAYTTDASGIQSSGPTDRNVEVCGSLDGCYFGGDPFAQNVDTLYYATSYCPIQYLGWNWVEFDDYPQFCVPDVDGDDGANEGSLRCPAGYSFGESPFYQCYPDMSLSECETFSNSQGWNGFVLSSVGSNGAVVCLDDGSEPDTGGGDFDDSGIIAAIEDQRDQQLAAIQAADTNNTDALTVNTDAITAADLNNTNSLASILAELEANTAAIENLDLSADEITNLSNVCSSPFTCTGDAFECAALEAEYNSYCVDFDAAAESDLDAGFAGYVNAEDLLADPNYVAEETVDTATLDWTTTGITVSGSCPDIPEMDLGSLGTIQMDNTQICTLMGWVGALVRLSAAISAFWIVFSAVREI